MLTANSNAATDLIDVRGIRHHKSFPDKIYPQTGVSIVKSMGRAVFDKLAAQAESVPAKVRFKALSALAGGATSREVQDRFGIAATTLCAVSPIHGYRWAVMFERQKTDCQSRLSHSIDHRRSPKIS